MDVAKIAATGSSVVNVIGRLAVLGGDVLPVLRIVADWSPIPIPFLSPVVSALELAQPWIVKIAAGAPIVEKAIEQGTPIAIALQEHGPAVFESFRQLFAIAVNADPKRTGPALTVADVDDAAVAEFATQSYRFAGKALFGQRWTDEQYELAWARQSRVTDVP